jgi:leader peptidase (prepilin peptidase)/N-methyltransferase
MTTAHAAVLAVFVAALVATSVVDARTRRIPNRIVLPTAAVVLAAQIATSPDRTLEWVLAALAAFLFMLAVHLVYPAGLGLGDVKLALLLGAALGWAVGAALVIGFLVAALAAIGLIVREGWAARKRTIPLGPFLAFGAVAALFLY